MSASRRGSISAATPKGISGSRTRLPSSGPKKVSPGSAASCPPGRRERSVGKGPEVMAESAAAKVARARKIVQRLKRVYPDAKIALRFDTPLELLVATILSAQCTDERVNAVTESLFKRYPSAKSYAEASAPTLERDIHATGFFRAKARSLIGMGKGLVERHGGEVPRTLEDLTALPGVGRKTANVVLGNAFAVPALAVATPVFRLSQRLGLAKADDPDEIHDH